MSETCNSRVFVTLLRNVLKPQRMEVLKTTYTLAEAAALLSCHKETLRRAIMDGNLRAARLGRGYRISRIDLEAFWAERGGGELFSSEERQRAEKEQEEERLAAALPKGKKAPTPMQLPLLPAGR